MSTTLGQMRINISVDSSEFERNITEVKNSLKTAQANFSAVSTTTDKMQKSINDLSNDYVALEGVLKEQYILMEKYKIALEEAESAENKNITAIAKAEQTYLKQVSAVNKVQLQMEALTRSMAEMELAEAKAIDEAHAMALEEEALRESVAKLNVGLAEHTKSTFTMGNAWKQAVQPLKDFGTNLTDIGKKITATSKDIAMNFGIATAVVGAGLYDAGKSAADFEAQMSRVKAVSNASASDMDKLKQSALDWGTKTQYSATQVGQAQEELLKAGVDLNTVLGQGLKDTLDLATAGEMNLADAATLASTAINSFADQKVTIKQAGDVLSGVANATAADIGGLRLGLEQSSAVADMMGVSFDRTAQALGIFSQNGLQGSDAGTSLKQMLLSLTPTSKTAVKQMEQLGLISYDSTKAMQVMAQMGLKPLSSDFNDVEEAMKKHLLATTKLKDGTPQLTKELNKAMQTAGFYSNTLYDGTGKLKDFSTVSQLLQDSTKGLTKEQEQMAFQVIFGTDAVRAASIIAKSGSKAFSDMGDALSKVTAADVAKTKMDNLEGTMTKLKNSFDTAKITIGNELLPTFKNLANGLQGVVDWFSHLDEGTKQNIVKFGLITTGVLGAVTALGILGGAIGGIVAGFGALSTALVFLTTNPVGLAILGVAALGIGFVALNKKMSESSLSFDRFGNGVSDSTKKALSSYMDMADKITNKLTDIKISNETMTSQMADTLKKDYADMNDAIIKDIQNRAAQEKLEMEKILLNNTNLSEQQKVQILANMQQTTDAQIKSLQKNMDDFNSIVEKATSEHRKTTDAENKQLLADVKSSETQIINTVSQSALEQKTIQERLNQDTSKLTAQAAADYAKQSIAKKNQAIKDANDTYNQQIAAVIKGRDVEHNITQGAADQIIRDLTKKKDQSVAIANEENDKIIKAAQKASGDQVNNVDWSTGQQLNKWQVFWNSLGSGWDNTNTKTKKNITDMTWNEQNWSDTTKKLMNAVPDSMDTMNTNLSIKANTTSSIFNTIGKNIKGAFQIDLGPIGNQMMQGLFNGMHQAVQKQPTTPINNAILGGFTNYWQIKSPSRTMRDQVGKWITAGLAQGLLDNVDMVKKASAQVSQAVNVVGAMNSNGTNGGGNSTTFSPNIVIQAPNSNPIDIVREQERVLRRLQFQGGIPR